MTAGMPADRVLAALDEVLGWPVIARSPQLASFLDYIVRKTLAGEEAGIKAYAIAVDVFGRPTSFDPQSDPIVRVQARRLRSLLDEFYADNPHPASGVKIILPVGRYVPAFVPLESGASGNVVAAPGPQAVTDWPDLTDAPVPPVAPVRVSRRGLAVLAGIAIVVFGVALFVALNPPAPPPGATVDVPGRPVVVVDAFADQTETGSATGAGAPLAGRVATLLSRFPDFEARSIAPAGTDAVPAEAYLVSGNIGSDAAGMTVTSLLSRGEDTLWTLASTVAADELEDTVIEGLARAIVRELAPLRGPIYDSAREWLDEQERPLPAVTPFVCLLTYRLARESGTSAHLADARVCHERLLAAEPDNAVAIASQALLDTQIRLNQLRPGEDVRTRLEEPLVEARRALSLAPESSFIIGVLGWIHGWRNEFADARRAFTDALERNPLDTDARSGYAMALARGVDWTLGVEQAERAIADSPTPSPWYYYPAAMNAWRAGRLEPALIYALRASLYGEGEVGSVLALAAAGMLGREQIVAELRPRVLSMERLRLWGIRPWLRAQVMDAEVADSVVEGLRRAGISEDALTEPF